MKFSLGNSSNYGKVRPVEMAWEDIMLRMQKHKIGEKGSAGFFVGGEFSSDKRDTEFMLNRTMLTLDIDGYLGDTDELVQRITNWLFGYHWTLYTTASHMQVNDKHPVPSVCVRVIIPLKEPFTDITNFNSSCKVFFDQLLVEYDPASLKPNQFMFLPTVLDGAECHATYGAGTFFKLPVVQRPKMEFKSEYAGDNSIDKGRDALRSIPAFVSYDDWIKIGMSIHAYGLPFEDFDEWSSKGDNYIGTDDCRKHWNSFKADKGITGNTLFFHAINNGWTEKLEDTESFFDTNKFILRTWDYFKTVKDLEWTIKGVLPKRGIASIYGDSGTGKSFLAINMAYSVSMGAKWQGVKTIKTPVCYIFLEGEAGLKQRLLAHNKYYGDGSNVMFITQDINIAEDYHELSQAIVNKLGEGTLVIIDTFNRSTLGMDENSSADMGTIISSYHKLQELVKGCVLMVHHKGKDALKGMRGHSSLIGALDASIEVNKTATDRTWLVKKSKDGHTDIENFFYLDIVEIGFDADGDVITSCVATPPSP